MLFRRITICGGGHAAHVLIALLGAAAAEVVVYAPWADEAERLARGAARGGLRARGAGRVRQGRASLVTRDPRTAFARSDLVLLALPATAHESVLRAAAPHLEDGAWVVALPARGGFDYLAGAVVPQARLAGFQTLPWACRVEAYGQEVHVLASKAVVDVAVEPFEEGADLLATLSGLLGVTLQPAGSFLAVTLANVGQIIHPGIMFGLFRAWDGTPLAPEDVPLFYGGVSEPTAQLLQALSNEVQAIRAQLANQTSEGAQRLAGVRPLGEWLVRAYPTTIEDRSSLRACFVTNTAYAGLRAPVRVTPGGLVPDFGYRYLSEDVPFGLLVTRGIAEIGQIPTPAMDRVILWAQDRLRRRWLVDKRLRGPDVVHTRAPQRFGMERLEDVVAR